MATRNDILIQISADLADLKRDMAELKNQVGGASDTIQSSFSGATATLAKFGLALQGARDILTTLAAPILSVVRTSAEFETLETRLVSLYGSAEDGARAFQTLADTASNTPFSVKSVVDAGATLKAFGADAEGLIQTMADLAAFMSVDITEAASSFGRAFAAGAGAADVLRERGVLQLVASFKGIDDLTKLTLPQFRAALIDALQNPAAGVAGSADRLAQTFEGSVSNMMDSFDRLKDAIGDELRPVLQELALDAKDLADGLVENIDNVKLALNGLSLVLAGFAANAGWNLLVNTVGRFTGLLAGLGGVAGVAKAALSTLAAPVTIVAGSIGLAVTSLKSSLDEMTHVFGDGDLRDDGEATAGTFHHMGQSLEDYQRIINNFNDDQLRTALREASNLLLEAEQTGAPKGEIDALNARLDAVRARREALEEERLASEESARIRSEEMRLSREAAQQMVDEAAARDAGYEDYRKYLVDKLNLLKKSSEDTYKEQAQLVIKIRQLDKAHQKEVLAEAERTAAELKAQEDANNLKRLNAVNAFLNDSLVMRRGNRDDQLQLLDDLTQIYSDNVDALYLIEQRRNAILDASWAESQAKLEQRFQQMSSLVNAIASQIGESIQSAFEGNLDGVRNALRNILLMIVDAIERQVLAAKVAAIANAIISSIANPFASIGAIAKQMPGLIALEALFAGLRASITKFETGGVIGQPTLALIGENVAASGREIVAPEKHFKAWATEVLLPHLTAGPSGADTKAHKLLEGVNSRLDRLEAALNPRKMGREMGRQLSMQARGKL